jgi:hypothetical protein
MSVYIGGSAYAMVRDIAEGYILVSENTFKKFQSSDFPDFLFELDKHTREVRGTVAPADDIEAVKKRARKLQRLQQALAIVNAFRMKFKR